MFSLKDSIRKTITLTLAATMATTVFVGCAKTKDTEDLNLPINSTTSITEDLAPGITENPAVIAKNTLFHWVEEPIGADLAITVSDFLEGAEQELDDISSLYGLPVMVKESTRYLHSGNLMLELTEDGDLADEQDAQLVRYAHKPDTVGGAKIYIYKNDNTKYISQMSLTADKDLIARTDKFWSVLDNQVATNHDEYVISCAVEDYAVEIPENALVWYNGIATDICAEGKLIPLAVLTDDFTNILSYEKTDTGYAFTLYTGIGAVKINATLNNDSWVFNYTLPEGIDERDSITLPAAEMSDASGNLCVSSKVLNEVFNYFVFSFSSVETDDGTTDIVVIITDNQDILYSNKTQREAADKRAQEQQAALDALKATPEQEAQAQKDKQDRQEIADAYAEANKDNKQPEKTTANGDLAEPAKPIEGVKTPEGSTTFTGDTNTALTTTLPKGCVWTPGAYGSKNAYTDPAGNVWLNNQRPKDPALDGNRNSGYYDPNGKYHPSQEEIDYAEDLNAAIHDINVNGPTGNGTSGMSEQDGEDLANLFGF